MSFLKRVRLKRLMPPCLVIIFSNIFVQLKNLRKINFLAVFAPLGQTLFSLVIIFA